MPFKFLDDNDSSVSSPPIVPPLNAAGSTAGEPKSTAPSYKFLDEKGVSPSASDLEDLMHQGYKPTNEDLRTIYESEQATPALKRLWKGTKEGAAGIVQPFLKAPGEFAEDPSASRLLSSAGEGITGAAAGTVGMVARPIRGIYDWMFKAPFRSDEENFERWKLNYLSTHDVGVEKLPTSIMKSWTEYANNQPVSESQMVQPYPNVSSAIGTVASIPMAEAAFGASGLSKALATPEFNLGAKALGVAGKVAEKVGTGFKWIGERPEAIAEGFTKRVLGEKMAEQVGHAVNVGELPAAGAAVLLGEPTVAATLATAKGLQKAAPMVSGAGAFARRIAEADPASPFGRLYSVAKDASAPEWMRHLADSWMMKVPAAMAETASTGIKTAGVGALFGGGLEALSGGDPEEIGRGIGSGGAFGALLAGATAPAMRKARIMQRSLASIEALYNAHIAEGISPDAMKKVSNEAMTWAATMEKMFADGTKIRFADTSKGSPLPLEVHGQAGLWNPQTKTLWINVDASRDPAATVLHEIAHPIFESSVVNRPEIKSQIDQALQASGRSLYMVKVRYMLSKLKDQLSKVTDPLQKRAILDQAIQAQDAASQASSGDPHLWAYAEVLSEASSRNLFGKHPIFDITDPSIVSIATDAFKEALQKMGVEFKEKPGSAGKPPTILPGFENVLDSPALRKAVYGIIKAQKAHRTDITPEASQGVKIMPMMWGQHPGAQLEDRADGTKGSDYVIQKPNGEIVARPAREVKKIVKNRRKEVNAMYPLGGEPLAANDPNPVIAVRTTPSGLVERSGTQLGPNFDNLQTFGSKTKANARDLEKAIANGEARQGWYQQIGESPDWKQSVQRDTGALEAQFKEFIPINFLVDTQGNLLVRNYSLMALERKAAEWAKRSGPASLQLWGGDVGRFKTDIETYLKNHAAGQPGEANNIGVEKKNVINAFLVGGNRTFEAKNPLRNGLRGSDRQGIVRSYRLDRLETLEPSQTTLPQPQYHKQVLNLSPEMASRDAQGRPLNPDGTVNFAQWQQEALEAQKTPDVNPKFTGTPTKAIESAGKPTAWILPNGTVKSLSEAYHESDLAKNSKVYNSEFGTKFSSSPKLSDRLKALNSGFVRVRYTPNDGAVRIEVAAPYWDSQKSTILNHVLQHESKIDNVFLNVVDKKGDVLANINEPVFKSENKEQAIREAFQSVKLPSGQAAKEPTLIQRARALPGEEGAPRFSPDVEVAQGQVKHNEEVRKNAEGYMEQTGRFYKPHEDYKTLDESYSKAVADFYDKATHDPENTEVQKAYKAFGDETVAQWQYLTDQGVKMEPWTEKGQPYKNSAEMTKDVRDNKHLYFFPTEGGFGTTDVKNHPLLSPSGIEMNGKQLLLNDVFRAVHDYFGHAKEGFEFGPRGEYNAYLAHSRMYSKEAVPAMAAETMGQNSWVNFGPQLRNAKGEIPKKGEEGYVPLPERAFAEQKATLLPPDLQQAGTGKSEKKLIEITGPDGKKYKARFDGWQDFTSLGRGKIAQITAVDDIPGVATAKSTTYAPSLEKKGYILPSFSPDVSEPKQIAEKLGARFDSEGAGRWLFTAFDESGKESTTFATKKDSTLEEVRAAYDAARARYEGEPDQPRPAALSPDIEKKLSKMTGARADELPTEQGDYWLTKDGKFLSVARHQQLADQLGVTTDDLYHSGLLRTIVRSGDNDTVKVVFNGIQDRPSLSTRQTQAIHTLRDRDFIVTLGSNKITDSIPGAMSPDLFSKEEMNPMGEKEENVLKKSLVLPNKELTPTELAASNLARKELRDRIQILPDADDRVKLRRALNRGYAEVGNILKKQMEDETFDSGADWYRKDLQSMEDTTRKLFPEAKDENKMTIFKTILATLSPSAKPTENYRSAAEAFSQYIKTGVVPSTTPYRLSETGEPKQLGITAEPASKKLNALLEQTGGEAQLVQYLMTKHPKTLYGNKDAYGALDLGPKVGRFLLNLTGHADEVTIDLWANRTFNRWMGTPFRKQSGKMELADVPTDKERNVMIEALGQIGQKLSEKTGQQLSAMDVQAILWFYEKDLYSQFAKSSNRESFSQAAKAYEAEPLHALPPKVTGQPTRQQMREFGKLSPDVPLPDALTQKGFGYIGQVDDDLNVKLFAGTLDKMFHEELGMYIYNPVQDKDRINFRYVPKSKTVYWWKTPSEKQKDALESTLAKKGYEVKSEKNIQDSITNWANSHGRNTLQEVKRRVKGFIYGHEGD